MSIIAIKGLTHQNGGKKLYNDAEIQINKGEHVALIGPNGSGKTTLFNIISGHNIVDHGDIDIHPKINLGYLDQHQDVNLELTADEYLKEAYKYLYEINSKIHEYYEKISIEYNEDYLVKALDLQEQLNHKGFDEIDKKIGNLISGLGIDQNNLTIKLAKLSGGQRGKILLARLLLQNNDFILLDEPTNFLDIEQVKWLSKFLQSYENAFLLISHDANFINDTVNIIYAIENLKINRYVGNFEKYLEVSEMRADQYDKQRKSQQQQISKLKEYISKNAARASTAKSAQSRQKQLNKIDVMDERKTQVKPNMIFKYKRPATSVTVKAEKLEIGYIHPLTKPLTFELREGEKCIVKGYNGIGKTTFLNTLSNLIKPISGLVEIGSGVEVNYFKQIESINDETPVEYLLKLVQDITPDQARAMLGRFGLKSVLMNNHMIKLSGGEQTKVRLASLAFKPSSLLILDEPTNHIDILAKESLLEAIIAFDGSVLITTHDINFETNWADKILDFEELTE